MTEQEAIEQIVKETCEACYGSDDSEKWRCGICGYKKAIEALEKQMSDRWIPVSEKLPSSDGMFMVTVKSRSGKRIDLCHFNKDAKLDNNKWGGQYYNRNVIAWKPLPKPYTEVSE